MNRLQSINLNPNFNYKNGTAKVKKNHNVFIRRGKRPLN